MKDICTLLSATNLFLATSSFTASLAFLGAAERAIITTIVINNVISISIIDIIPIIIIIIMIIIMNSIIIIIVIIIISSSSVIGLVLLLLSVLVLLLLIHVLLLLLSLLLFPRRGELSKHRYPKDPILYGDLAIASLWFRSDLYIILIIIIIYDYYHCDFTNYMCCLFTKHKWMFNEDIARGVKFRLFYEIQCRFLETSVGEAVARSPYETPSLLLG